MTTEANLAVAPSWLGPEMLQASPPVDLEKIAQAGTLRTGRLVSDRASLSRMSELKRLVTRFELSVT
eukprot:scaffold671087_cov109-Prasinocladus_malaysianus.AAC.1